MLLAAGWLVAPHALAAEADCPNGVFVLADGLGYGDLGSHGQAIT